VYTVFLTNFGHQVCDPVQTLAEAKDQARSTGLECTIYLNGELVGGYSPLNGYEPFVE